MSMLRNRSGANKSLNEDTARWIRAQATAKATSVSRLVGDMLRERGFLQMPSIRMRWLGLRRIRVGSYRVIYDVRETEPIVLVVAVGHRLPPQWIFRTAWLAG